MGAPFGSGWRAMLAAIAILLTANIGAASAQTAAPETSPEAAAPSADAALAPLLEVLKDDAARAKLIEALSADGATPAEQTATETPAAEPQPRKEPPSAAEVADEAEQFATRLLNRAVAVFGRVYDAFAGFADLAEIPAALDTPGAVAAIFGLLTLIGVTTALRWALDRLAERPIGWLNEWRRSLPGRQFGVVAAYLGAACVRAAVILLAFAAGLGLTLLLPTGLNGEALAYLTAFVIVELAKLGARTLLAPQAQALRLLPMDDASALFAYARAALSISLLGYGLVLVGPVLTETISFQLGRAAQTVSMLAAAILAIVSFWSLRQKLRDGADAPDLGGGAELSERVTALMGRIWPHLATVYVLAMLVVAIGRPLNTRLFLVEATVYSVLAVVIGLAAMAFLNRSLKPAALLPKRFHGELPRLERRLEIAAPRVLFGARILVIAGVVAKVLHVWGVINVIDWLQRGASAQLLIALGSALTAVTVGYIAWLAIGGYVEYRLSDRVGRAPTTRERTLLPMVFNGVSILTVVFCGMTALSELGLNIAPLLAGAGVVGLAVGFGAQTLVRDIITGVFIQLENALNEGDVVTVAGVTGTVEKLSLRCVNIRDLSGTLHVTPFSEVTTVSNFMRGYAFHVAEIGVAYKEDVETAKEAMREAFEKLRDLDDDGSVLADLEMHGVIALGDSAVVIRARIKTRPGMQWSVGRRYTECVKEVFDARGIEIPFPHMTLVSGVDKAGHTLLTAAPSGLDQPADQTPATEDPATKRAALQKKASTTSNTAEGRVDAPSFEEVGK